MMLARPSGFGLPTPPSMSLPTGCLSPISKQTLIQKITLDSPFQEMKSFDRGKVFGEVGGAGWDDILCIRESGRITVTEERESAR